MNQSGSAIGKALYSRRSSLMSDKGMSMMSKYKVGDRIHVKKGKEHDDGDEDDMGKGTIVEVGSQALAIKFDGMNEVHKWYVDAEVEKAR